MKKIVRLTENNLSRIVKKIIKEDKEEEFINKVDKFIVVPYFYNLKATCVPEHLWEKILSKKFDRKVTLSEIQPDESDPTGRVGVRGWHMSVKDSNGNEIYIEYPDEKWSKFEYDSNDNEIYYENSTGVWSKRKYDSNDNLIYYENEYVTGSQRYEWDSRGNVIYFEDEYRQWEKFEYDSNDNLIYYENSTGKWVKNEYDSKGNVVSQENSDGKK